MEVSLFLIFLKISHQDWNYSKNPVCTLVPRRPWTHRSADKQQSESEKQLPLSSFRPQISEPDMTRRSFPQLSLFVIWRPGFLKTSVEFISCVCWGNTGELSSLKEVKCTGNAETCCLTPAFSCKRVWKIQTLSLVYNVYDRVRLIQPS